MRHVLEFSRDRNLHCIHPETDAEIWTAFILKQMQRPIPMRSTMVFRVFQRQKSALHSF
jgi:hypothetical protein